MSKIQIEIEVTHAREFYKILHVFEKNQLIGNKDFIEDFAEKPEFTGMIMEFKDKLHKVFLEMPEEEFQKLFREDLEDYRRSRKEEQ